MKRFLCTTCGRIIRVRRLPLDYALNTESHVAAAHHVGICGHHGAGAPRRRVNDRGRVLHQRAAKKPSEPQKQRKP